MNKLMQTVTENVAYVVIFLTVIVGCFLVAVVLEKGSQKKNGISEPIFNTRKLAMIGMFSAIAMILHVLDFPLNDSEHASLMKSAEILKDAADSLVISKI